MNDLVWKAWKALDIPGVAEAFSALLGKKGFWTDFRKDSSGEGAWLKDLGDILEHELIEAQEFSDPDEFTEALGNLKASSDFNQCGNGTETTVRWIAVGGARGLAVAGSECYLSDVWEEGDGETSSFQVDQPGTFVVEVAEREVGIYNYIVRRFKVFTYSPSPTVGAGADKGDYRQMRNRRDVMEFAPDVAREVMFRLSENELNGFACAIRAGRVGTKDVRDKSFKKTQRALTVATRYKCTQPGNRNGDAGTKIVSSWTSSSDIVIGESYRGDSYGSDARDYGEKRWYTKPRFSFGESGWALMRIRRWANWPVEGSGNFSRDYYLFVLVGEQGKKTEMETEMGVGK